MKSMEQARQIVLDEIQSGFPLVHDPYGELGNRLGLTRDQVLEAVESLRADGTIRQICASLSSRKLGYTSTLVAVKVAGDQDAIDRAADLISAHPEVTHNYLRPAEFNVWFTAIAPSKARLEQLVEEVAAETGCDDIMNLPVTAMYKIRVDFGHRDNAAGEARAARKVEVPASAQFDADDPFDIALIRWAQADTAGEHPFQEAAARIAAETGDGSVDERRVIARLEEWKAAGVVRRFGAFVRHQKLGYAYNGMTLWEVGEDAQRETGRSFACLPFVSHCYGRVRCERWPYNLYAMVHAKTQEELDCYVAQMEELCRLKARVLVSTKEYKKTLPVYFT